VLLAFRFLPRGASEFPIFPPFSVYAGTRTLGDFLFSFRRWRNPPLAVAFLTLFAPPPHVSFFLILCWHLMHLCGVAWFVFYLLLAYFGILRAALKLCPFLAPTACPFFPAGVSQVYLPLGPQKQGLSILFYSASACYKLWSPFWTISL